MNLIRLTMTAFGPYKNNQVIDFTELEDRKLFVISGATGAGKTTIFDAITFALYGTASGSDRDNITMLRSHFADEAVHTSVELIFQLHDKKFRVFRQLGHVKEGNRTPTGTRFEFFEITEEGEVPAVDRQIVTEINNKIESLIGLTASQFKQIVMLPQGEFRKLLTSSTENKEDILRRLFQTKRYQIMNELLKQKQEAIQLEYNSEQQELERYINSIETTLVDREESTLFSLIKDDYVQVDQVIDQLNHEVRFYEAKIAEDEKVYEKTVQEFDEQHKRMSAARTINEQFAELEDKQKNLQDLLVQKEKINNDESRWKAAERASKIEPYEKYLTDREEEKRQLEAKISQTEINVKQAEDKLTVAREQFIEEEHRYRNREQLVKQLNELETYLPTVQTMNTEKEQIEHLKNELNRMEQQISDLRKQIDEKENAIKSMKDTMRVSSEKVKMLHNQKLKRHELLNRYSLWDKLIVHLKDLVNLQQSIQKYRAQYKEAEKELKILESKWIEQQASVLARSLTDGEACPVCGSTHHPNKQHETSDIVSDEELNEKKQIVQQILNKGHELQGKIASVEAAIEQLKREIGIKHVLLEEAEQNRNEIREQGLLLKEEIDSLEKIEAEVQEIELKLEKLETKLESQKLDHEKLENEKNKKQIELTAKLATFKEKTRVIPEEFHKIKQLQSKISNTKKVIDELESAYKRAQENVLEAETEVTKQKTQLDQLTLQINEVNKKVETERQQLLKQIKQANFVDIEQYKQAKLSEVEREQLKQKIEQYKQQVITLQKQINELQDKLKDKEKINLEEMERKVTELKERYEKALEQVNRSKDVKLKAEQLIENIATTFKRVNQLEKQLVAVKDVYDVVRGQNSKKISFERYLLIDYLDQIIFAANSRFKTLSDGQYQLVRSERQESHGRQSGLMIDVYDGFTGQLRDVKTLSGGEKFIASLCLALGMSDVIQSFQGNIQIDTMFIDEGFGSLDEESLHKSIDALIQLQQSGRTIGVISHVDELKRIFPARLEVTKSKEGHSSASFVLR